jgi:hypothetical protein
MRVFVRNRRLKGESNTFMTVARATPVLTLFGDPDSSDVKAAIEVLDRSGLDYRISASPIPRNLVGNAGQNPGEDGFPTVQSGADYLARFSKQELVDFLMNHGARFEDS